MRIKPQHFDPRNSVFRPQLGHPWDVFDPVRKFQPAVPTPNPHRRRSPQFFRRSSPIDVNSKIEKKFPLRNSNSPGSPGRPGPRLPGPIGLRTGYRLRARSPPGSRLRSPEFTKNRNSQNIRRKFRPRGDPEIFPRDRNRTSRGARRIEPGRNPTSPRRAVDVRKTPNRGLPRTPARTFLPNLLRPSPSRRKIEKRSPRAPRSAEPPKIAPFRRWDVAKSKTPKIGDVSPPGKFPVGGGVSESKTRKFRDPARRAKTVRSRQLVESGVVPYSKNAFG